MAEAKTMADLIEDRFGLPTRAGREMPAEGTVATMLSHRVHRRWKPDPISDETLEIVLAAALSAPSKSDLQQVGIVLVRDRAKQSLIASWIEDMPWIADAPLFMVFCGDHRRMRRGVGLRREPVPHQTPGLFMKARLGAAPVEARLLHAREARG